MADHSSPYKGLLTELRTHLYEAHANNAAGYLSNEEAIGQHEHEHNGPGCIRNHDQPAELHDWSHRGGVSANTGPATLHPKVIEATDREGDAWERYIGNVWRMVDHRSVTAREDFLQATCGPLTPTAYAGKRGKTEPTNPAGLPERGDTVAEWIKRQRDEYPARLSDEWYTLDRLLDDYRLHADCGTPLTEPTPSETTAGVTDD